MVFGITNRAGWVNNSPEHLWKFFDAYKISEKELLGYWQKECPVKCSSRSFKASVFSGAYEAVISVANWTDKDQMVSLSVDWKKLGIDPFKVEISMPGIENFQEAKKDVSLNNIIVPGKQGFLIALKKKK